MRLKRILSALLALCMVLAWMPVTASAATIASGTCGDELTWVLDENGTLTISGTGAMYNYTARSAPWYDAEVTVRRIIIEEGVTSVGSYAFGANYGSVWLTVIPSSLTSIGREAFMCGSRCVVINSETIAKGANSYDSLGYLLFRTYSVLIKDGISYGSYVSNGRTYTSMGEFKGVTYNVFSGCSGHAYKQSDVLGIDLLICDQCYAVRDFSEIEFDVSATEDDHVTAKIYKSGDDVILNFSGCGNIDASDLPWHDYRYLITRVEIDDGVTSIPDRAFYYFPDLTSITIPNGITSIGYLAFGDCTSLTSIIIPEGVTEIGSRAFYNCTSLTEIKFQGDAPAMADDAFSYVVATAYYPAGYTTWTSDVMQNYGGTITWSLVCVASGVCGDDATWVLAENGTLIISGTGSLYSYNSGTNYPWYAWCDDVKNVVIQDGVTRIPSYAFEYMTEIQTVRLPNTLEILACNAFNDCTSLNNLLIPASVKELAYACYFNRCNALTDVYYMGTSEEWANVVNRKLIGSPYDNVETVHFLMLTEQEATCTESGVEAHYRFDDTSVYAGYYDLNKEPIAQPVTIPATGHNYASIETTPTCTEQGYTSNTCTTCGDSYVDSYVDATGIHTYENGICTGCGIRLPADINGDGEVNNKDLTRLFQYLSGYHVEVSEAALDINGDGSVNNKDLTRLFQYLSGWDVTIN